MADLIDILRLIYEPTASHRFTRAKLTFKSLLVGHSPLRGCSLLTPRGRPKSLATPSVVIYEMPSNGF